MKYLHYMFDVGSKDIIQVTLDKQANVKLLDGTNYQRYRNGRQYSYYGGLAKVSPINMKPPHQGCWHVVVDLGGYAGTVHASAQIIRG